MKPPPSIPKRESKRHGLLLPFLAACVVVGAVVGANLMFDHTRPVAPMPVVAEVHGDFTATERSGQTVHFSDLRGKVVVCAYLYTACPHGCAAVTAQMQQLLKRFGDRPDFHLLSVAVHPNRDTPALLEAYAEAVGATAKSPWWFVTGEEKPLQDFMTEQLHLEPAKAVPDDERINPLELYEHDLRVVLIDRKGRVRRYFAVFHPQPEISALMCENLPLDVQRLLEQPEL